MDNRILYFSGKIPKYKHQITNNFQIRNFNDQNWAFPGSSVEKHSTPVWDFEFGYCDLFVI